MKPNPWIIVLFGAALCLYLPFLSNPFIYDDFHSLVWNPVLRDWDRWLALWFDPTLFSSDPQRPMYRPLLLFSYLLSGITGHSEASYRAGNLFLHLQAGALVYLLTSWLVCRRAAKWAVGLFLLHPVFSEPVFYISSRSESLMAGYALAALYAYSRNRYGWAAMLSAMAMLSKETAVVLPLMFLLYDYIWGQPPLVTIRALICRCLPFSLSAGYLALSWHFGLLAGAGSRAGRSGWEQFWTQTVVLREYALALIWPMNWGLEGTVPATAGPTLVGLLSVGLVIAGCWWAWRKKGVWLFLWGGFWLTLLPTLVVPLNILMADRRLYWPGVFLCLGAGTMIANLERKFGQVVVWIGVMVFAVLALGTWQRGQTWASATRLWVQTVEQAPDSYRALMNYGTELTQGADKKAAEIIFKRALAAADNTADSAQALGNLGSLHFTAGRLDTAFACYVKSIQLDSLQAGTWANLGMLWLEMGKKSPTIIDRQVRWQGAEAFLSNALRLNPNHRQAHLGLANLYQHTDRPEQAEAERRLAEVMQPDQVLVPYVEAKK